MLLRVVTKTVKFFKCPCWCEDNIKRENKRRYGQGENVTHAYRYAVVFDFFMPPKGNIKIDLSLRVSARKSCPD